MNYLLQSQSSTFKNTQESPYSFVYVDLYSIIVDDDHIIII